MSGDVGRHRTTCCHVCDRIERWTMSELDVLVRGSALAGDLHVFSATSREQRRRKSDDASPPVTS